jgi:hypothetical protein
MSRREAATVTQPHNPLRKALKGAYLIGREVALERAKGNIEARRGDLTASLKLEVAALDALIGQGALTQNTLDSGIVLAPVICNLAGALGYDLLRSVASSLHDLLVILNDRGLLCPEPVLVHLHAARLAAPGMPKIPAEAAKHLLAQLHAVVSRSRDAADPCTALCKNCAPAR